jgi:hypothetical protein
VDVTLYVCQSLLERQLEYHNVHHHWSVASHFCKVFEEIHAVLPIIDANTSFRGGITTVDC